MKDELIAQYLSDGVLDLYIDDDGQEWYRLGPNCKQFAPDLWALHNEEISDIITSLYNKGLVDFRFDDNLDIRWFRTEAGEALIRRLDDRPLA